MDEEPRHLTAKRAKDDPVIGPFIEKAKEEITYHHKFRIESLVKALNLQFHRAPLYEHMPRIARIIEKDLGCKLVSFAGQNLLGDLSLAGVGKGSRTCGYVRAGKEYAKLSDAANNRRVGLTNGMARVHNEIAEIVQSETGEERKRLTTQLEKLGPPKPPAGTLRIAKSFIEALKGEGK